MPLLNLLKKLLLGLFLLIIASVVIIVLYIYHLDPNKLKPMLIAQVAQRTGYALAIDGDLSWSFYPYASVKISHMTLREKIQTKPFLDLTDTRIAMPAFALLMGNKVLEGDMTIAAVRLLNLHARNVKATLHWEKQIFTINPLRAALYGGTLVGNAHGRSLVATPEWDWNVAFDNIQLQSLLQDVNPKGKLMVSGVGKVTLRAETHGNNKQALLSHVNGSGTFSLTKGVVKALNINYLLQTADNLINKQPITPPPTMDQTEFSSLTGSFKLKNGVSQTDDLLLTATTLQARGQGSINLLSQSIDWQLQVKTQAQLKTQWEVPILVTGTLSHPNARIDTISIQKAIVKKQVERLEDKAVKEIKRHIPEEAGKMLQNILGQ